MSRAEHSRSRPGAFTLTEMIVVITIIAILLAVTIPGFTAMLYSSEQSLSENVLRTAIRSGRDLAVKSGADRDVAVVFMYDPASQRTQAVPCVKIGSLRDTNPTDARGDIVREVFVASSEAPIVTLPKGWMVRGFVPPGFILTGAASDNWYNGGIYTPTAANWVFPETAFYDVRSATGGRNRNSFMIRFEAGTGMVSMGDADAVLVLAPRRQAAAAQVEEGGAPAAAEDAYDLDQVDSNEDYVKRVLAAPRSALTLDLKRRLIGRDSPDMVLCRPVGQIALYDENRLAGTLGARTDSVSGSLYVRPSYIDPQNGTTVAPELVTGVTQSRINRWIEGDTNGDDRVSSASAASPDRPESRIFTIDRYTGALQLVEVQP